MAKLTLKGDGFKDAEAQGGGYTWSLGCCVRNSPSTKGASLHPKPITIFHVSLWSSSLQCVIRVPVGTQHSLWNGGEKKKEDIVYFCCDRGKPGIFSIPRQLSVLSLIAWLCLFPNPDLQIDPKGLLPLESSRLSSRVTPWKVQPKP